MKQTALAGCISLMLLAPVQAQDYRPLVDALFGHMTATYMCREALGGLGQYQAARSIATSVASRLLGANLGVSTIDAFEKRLQDDPRSNTPMGNPSACNEMVSNGLQKIAVEQARQGLL